MFDTQKFLPDLIHNLPDADVPFEGVNCKILQSEDGLLGFFEIESIGEVPPHSHGAQWGIVLDGEMDLTIGGETKTYNKGDSYSIPSGVVHSVAVKAKVYVIDFFEDTDRYLPKKKV